ncbi:MAG: hypothetical protein ACRBF0_11945 [Calditrichia bacterium]
MRFAKFYLILALLSAFTLGMFGQAHNAAIATYTINCSYNPETRIIDGEMQIWWSKPLEPKAEELQFHLYLNAFSGPNSTFMKEYGEFPTSVAQKSGYCKIQKIEIYNIDVTESMKFIQPNDGNEHDSTVIAIPIPEPQDITFNENPNTPTLLLSAERQKSTPQLSIKIKFQSKLPALLERVGVYEGFIMAAQWFPQLGVLEEEGWKCHQFHANSEFYANFGTYDVSLTLPANYVVGATGEMLERKMLPGSLQKLRFKARRVHDFAWCADATMSEVWVAASGPHVFCGNSIIQKEQSQSERLQSNAKSQIQSEPRIRLLYQPEHEGLISERILTAVKAGLNYYESRYGKYPYFTNNCNRRPGFQRRYGVSYSFPNREFRRL